MADGMMNWVRTDAGSAAHWDDAYALGEATRSWFQDQPHSSLHLIDIAGVVPQDSVVDVGGGASTLIDALLGRGFTDTTVLDISAAGLQRAKQRLGEDAGRVQWLVTDILTWQPRRTYQVWHDRALFHFLTTSRAQQQYLQTLHAATSPSAVAVFACFAADGPKQCSGLPVARYDARDLAATLGRQWRLIAQDREEHDTPTGMVQPFTWAAFRRNPSDDAVDLLPPVGSNPQPTD